LMASAIADAVVDVDDDDDVGWDTLGGVCDVRSVGETVGDGGNDSVGDGVASGQLIAGAGDAVDGRVCDADVDTVGESLLDDEIGGALADDGVGGSLADDGRNSAGKCARNWNDGDSDTGFAVGADVVAGTFCCFPLAGVTTTGRSDVGRCSAVGVRTVGVGGTGCRRPGVTAGDK